MKKNMVFCFFFLTLLFSLSTQAEEPSIILKEGDRIEFNRNGKRTHATVTAVAGIGVDVLQDDGQRFSFTTSKDYAAMYQVELMSGAAAKANPEHKVIASRPPTLCPETSPKQGQTPDKNLLRTLVTCRLEDTSNGGVYAGKTINLDIISFQTGKVYKRGNTLAYHAPDAPITPVRVKFNQRIYNTGEVTVTKGAIYDFDVYVDYNNRWAVNPRIIKMGKISNVPMSE